MGLEACPKNSSDGADETFCGRLFHSPRELSGDQKGLVTDG